MGKLADRQIKKSLHILAVSSLVVFFGVALSKILTYIYRIIIARSFGPAEYGLFSLATMIATFIVVIASIGLPEGIVRYVSFYRGKKDEKSIAVVLKKTKIALIIAGVLGGGFLALFAKDISIQFFHTLSLVPFLYIAAISVPFFIMANYYLAVLKAYEKIGHYSFSVNFVQNFFKVIALVLLIFTGIKINAVMFSFLAGILAMFLFAYVFAGAYIKKIKASLSEYKQKKIFYEVISYSWPLSLLGVASFALYWMDSFTIGYFMSPEHVGLYNVAIPISALIMIAPDLIVQLFFPLIMKEYSQNKKYLIEQLSKQVMKWIFIVNLPIVVILVLFPGAAINLLFDSQYLVAENSLRLLAIGSLFSSLTIIPNHLISMTGKSKTILYNILAMLVLNFALNIILVPRYGIDGAAFSTMIMLIMLSILTSYQTGKLLSFVPLRRKMLPAFIACLISLVPLSFLKLYINLNIISIMLIGIIFLLSYILLVFLFEALDKNDTYLLVKLKNKIFMRIN